MAQACRDWHVTRKVFSGWRRWAKKIQNDKIMAEEIQKAKTLRLFESRVTKQKDEILITRVFTAWRLFAKQECERRKLLEAEQEMKSKMESLLSKLKQRTHPLEDIEDTPEVTPIIPFYPADGSQKATPHEDYPQTDQSTTACDTKAMIKNFQDEFKLLKAQRTRDDRLRKKQESSLISESKPETPSSKRVVSKTIESLVKPHKSVLSMEERKLEREKRKNEIIALKKKKEEELEAKKREERRIANEQALQERKRKREELIAQKQAKENQEKLKQEAKQKAQENIKRANEHHKRLLKRRSLNALKVWSIAEKAKNTEKVKTARLEKLRPLLTRWSEFVQQKLTANQRTADHFRYQKLTSNIITHWKLIKEIEHFQQNRADAFYKAKLPRKCIALWSQEVMNNKVELWRGEKIAVAHHNKSLLSISIKMWRKLKKFNEEEKKREDRRNKLRHLVKEVIEDF
ncbi:Oidioi.mRNA.OKI2018_I69.XSR.g16197.t1.cds [Oikopleura dioica]|uniref:Oidioi.mRNA.OKI2018_I69.XSR.g16197.t1.cds n=1 Tax=Oikopleura dioica TaxID=34765 RepID=A0ABN7SKF9_OIKDI|nr:Oidioi.mRNA.OKI2018_I69.XSR.g16197.t1.cds [Oikopleura dioica]